MRITWQKISKIWNMVANAWTKFVLLLEENGELVLIVLSSIAIVLAILGAAFIKTAAAAIISWIIVLAPILAVAAAIAFVLLVLNDLYHSIFDGYGAFYDLWDNIKKGFRSLWEAMKKDTDSAVGWLVAKIEAIMNRVKAVKAFYDRITGKSDDDRSTLSRFWEGVKMDISDSRSDGTSGIHGDNQPRLKITPNFGGGNKTVTVNTPVNVTINAQGMSAEEISSTISRTQENESRRAMSTIGEE
jgi:hypothetical protein